MSARVRLYRKCERGTPVEEGLGSPEKRNEGRRCEDCRQTSANSAGGMPGSATRTGAEREISPVSGSASVRMFMGWKHSPGASPLVTSTSKGTSRERIDAGLSPARRISSAICGVVSAYTGSPARVRNGSLARCATGVRPVFRAVFTTAAQPAEAMFFEEIVGCLRSPAARSIHCQRSCVRPLPGFANGIDDAPA